MISSVRKALQVCLLASFLICHSFLGAAAQELDFEGFQEMELPGELRGSVLFYKFNDADDRADGQDTISVVYQVPTEGWVGWAVNRNSFMQDANAIIGLPETGEVKKYFLGGYAVNAIEQLPDEQQTLIDASIQRTEDMTILSFTKILVEPDEHPITRSGRTTVLSAWGSTNQLAKHDAKGIYSVQGSSDSSNSPPSPLFKGLIEALGALIVGTLALML